MPSTTKSKLVIEIQYASTAIEKLLASIASPILMKKWVSAAMDRGGLLTLRFVNSSEGKKLNFTFRKKDWPTNVLTFPYELSKEAVLADIVFCLPVIQKEAKEQEKMLKEHLAHLIVHGCLHAQGLDHEGDKEAKQMEKREINILQSLGFHNPYQSI